jgi:hypothetical protein
VSSRLTWRFSSPKAAGSHARNGALTGTFLNRDSAGWNNPGSTDPPVHFFEGDPAIGLYSVQFTATDTVAWGGIPNTQKCHIEGLCNPQYIFYRKGYRIAINTWGECYLLVFSDLCLSSNGHHSRIPGPRLGLPIFWWTELLRTVLLGRLGSIFDRRRCMGRELCNSLHR